MKKQRGQAIVEFALVLPMFMLLLFGVILSGLLFADYMTLSNVARSSAREAALSGEDKNTEIKNAYKEKLHLISNLYTLPTDDKWLEFDRSNPDIDKGVTVVIKANLNKNFPGVGVVSYITGAKFPPDTYEIRYTMHDEAGSSSSE